MITNSRSHSTNNIEKVKITRNWPVGTSRVKIYRFCSTDSVDRPTTLVVSELPVPGNMASPSPLFAAAPGLPLRFAGYYDLPATWSQPQAVCRTPKARSRKLEKSFPNRLPGPATGGGKFPATDAANHSCKMGPLSSIMGPMKFILDIGGEGAHPHAWNLNPSQVKTLNPHRGTPIPRHIPGRADAIPLPDHSVDQIIVERTPLRKAALAEIVRVLQRPGSVVLRHAMATDLDPHRLARTILPGLVRQRSIWIGRQMVLESYFRTEPVPHR